VQFDAESWCSGAAARELMGVGTAAPASFVRDFADAWADVLERTTAAAPIRVRGVHATAAWSARSLTRDAGA
jgi:hypothetical protein